MTNFQRIRKGGFLPLVFCALLALVSGSAGAATITILNNDGAGEGFNDPAARAPVPGNPGVTLGQQRLNLFNHAASIWGSIIPSSVTIVVRAQFNPQTCNATSATLGSAGPVTIHRDFTNAPFTGFWYHQALANRLSGVDQSAANPDINATFNSTLDGGTCLGGAVWYYGTDGNEGPVNVELLPVLLHEMGHGLGFSTSTNGSTGAFNSGFPHIYDRFLMDNSLGLHWYQMTAAQRVASAISGDRLVWDGPQAIAQAATYLGKRPRLLVNSPGSIAGSYPAGAAAFGPALTVAGVTGDVVLMDDATAPDNNDACEPLVNGPALVGKIAIVNRGTCTFVLKAQAAQAAGAIALLIVNNVAGITPPGGTDPACTIPVVGITTVDGNAIKAELLNGPVNVTLGLDPVLVAGADTAGRPMCYAPNPIQGGSSVSHWDVTMFPNALMEPAINGDLHDSIDLTLGHFKDIGWFPETTATTVQDFVAEGRNDGVLLRWRFEDPSDVSSILVERAGTVDGPWSRPQVQMGEEGAYVTAFDASAEPGATYYYRLNVTDRAGEAMILGMVSVQRPSALAGRVFLSAPMPNPAVGGSSVSFRIGRPEYVRLAVLDVSGRKVRTLHEGMMLAGEYMQTWDGRDEHHNAVAAGVYFINLRTSQGVKTQRVAIVR